MNKFRKIVFLLALSSSLSINGAPNSIIAIVNDEIITLDSISQKFKPSYKKSDKLSLLEKQIDLTLQQEKIKALGIQPKTESINAMLSNIAANNGITFAQLKLNNQFDEIAKNVVLQLSLRGLKQIILEKANIQLTQSEFEQALAKNPSTESDFSQQVKIAQIVINSIEQKAALIESKDELMRKFLADLREKIQQGDSFSKLAKLYSHDPSYQQGGESAWLDKQKLPAVFKQQLSHLKPNETSQPFKTGESWRIIKLVSERKVDNHSTKLKSTLLQDKQTAYFDNWLKTLREDAYIDIFEHKLD